MRMSVDKELVLIFAEFKEVGRKKMAVECSIPRVVGRILPTYRHSHFFLDHMTINRLGSAFRWQSTETYPTIVPTYISLVLRVVKVVPTAEEAAEFSSNLKSDLLVPDMYATLKRQPEAFIVVAAAWNAWEFIKTPRKKPSYSATVISFRQHFHAVENAWTMYVTTYTKMNETIAK